MTTVTQSQILSRNPLQSFGMFVLLLVITSLIKEAQAYHHGGTDTNCWLGPNYQQLLSSCTDLAEIEFTAQPSPTEILHTEDPFTVASVLTPFVDLLPIDGYLVSHANIHMCRVEMGWCTPDVQAQRDLVTQSPETKSNSTLLNVTDLIVRIPGEWSIVAHYTIRTANGEYDLAAGFRRQFIKRQTLVPVEAWAVVLVYVLASIGIVLSIIVGTMILLARGHWVFRASSPNLSLIVVFGCFLAFVTAFILPPPSTSTTDQNDERSFSMSCNARIWLLSLSFDFVLVPLALKTWRVSVLFDKCSSFRRVNITDAALTKSALLILLVDVIYCIVWTVGFPLHVGKIPSVASPKSFYTHQCFGKDQQVFELVSITFHGLPLVWLAFIGRRVRSSFRKRSIESTTSATDSIQHGGSSFGGGHGPLVVPNRATERKMSQFNESESLAMTLAMLACVSIFAIALQYTVTDAPTAQMLMVSGGVLWSAVFIIIVMFIPRFVDFMRLEKDGITKRQSSDNVSSVIGSMILLRRTLSAENSITSSFKRQSNTADRLTLAGSSPFSTSKTTANKDKKSASFAGLPSSILNNHADQIQMVENRAGNEIIIKRISNPMPDTEKHHSSDYIDDLDLL